MIRTRININRVFVKYIRSPLRSVYDFILILDFFLFGPRAEWMFYNIETETIGKRVFKQIEIKFTFVTKNKFNVRHKSVGQYSIKYPLESLIIPSIFESLEVDLYLYYIVCGCTFLFACM